ncbi:ABC transporter permease subunit [Orbaceae bacterium ESL0727]|nr:ABC transporter permease subunit [Orbaceae bacterium ESL0727]
MFNQLTQKTIIHFDWLPLLLKKLHSNIYLLISTYGIIAIIGLVLSTRWFFHAQVDPIYIASLPPAWWANGDVNHILGTDINGQDIFDYLLISYRTTTVMTIKTLLYIVIFGAIINYLLFFIPFLRSLLLLILRLFAAIPPLLGVIVISLVFKNSTTNLLIVIGLTYMPRFIYNVHTKIIQESLKTYITAYRLDGLSSFQILSRCIIPNIFPFYLTEIISLFGQMILAITTLTFLGFANDIDHPDLGMMMFQMKSIIYSNYWAFLSPGLAIIITITLVYLLSFGLHNQRIGN